MLNAFRDLLCSKLCWHDMPGPTKLNTVVFASQNTKYIYIITHKPVLRNTKYFESIVKNTFNLRVSYILYHMYIFSLAICDQICHKDLVAACTVSKHTYTHISTLKFWPFLTLLYHTL